MPFDATLGGPAANSYIDVATADAYFERRLNSTPFTTASLAVKQNALMAGTNRLEQEEYVGRRASSAQTLKWPRSGVCDEDGYPVSVNAQPKEIIGAVCEMALALLVSGATDLLAPTGLEQFEHIQVGSLDITPRDDAPRPGALPPAVSRWLRRLLVTSTGISKLVRG